MATKYPGQVSNLIKKTRLKAKLTQAEVAKSLKLLGENDQVLVCQWEMGSRPIRPTAPQKRALAKFVGLSVGDLNKMLEEDAASRTQRISKIKSKSRKKTGEALKKELDAQVKREVDLQAEVAKTIKTNLKTPAKAPPTVPPMLVSPPEIRDLSSANDDIKNVVPTPKTALLNGLTAQEHIAAALLAREPMIHLSPAAFIRIAEQYQTLSGMLDS